MEAILHTFGIDWRLLLINAVNFGLLMGVLWYFLYAPVMRMLEERRSKVEQGVRDAEAAAQARAQTEGERKEVLAKAGAEADAVVAAARHSGSELEKQLREKGEAQAALALKEAEIRAAEMKERAVEESRKEVAKLIVLGMEKIK